MRQIRLPIERFEGPCQRIPWPEVREGEPDSILLIQRRGGWYAFQNHCPHWQIPLTERGQDAFDEASGYLICTSHAAIFSLRNGLCVSGPCEDEHLQTLDVHLEGKELVITEPSRSLRMSFSGLATSSEE